MKPRHSEAGNKRSDKRVLELSKNLEEQAKIEELEKQAEVDKVAALTGIACISVLALACIKTEIELGNPDDALHLIDRIFGDIKSVGDKLDIDFGIRTTEQD